MQQSRREIVDELLDYFGELNDANARTTAELAVNRAIGKIWLKHTWLQFEQPTQYQFASVVNQASYALPSYFGRPIPRVPARNLTTAREVKEQFMSEILRDDPTYGTTLGIAGEPAYFFISGSWPTTQQPLAATAFEVVSDVGADTGIKVSILGLDTNGNEQRLQFQMNGITPVAVGTWTQFFEFSKAVPAGTAPMIKYTSSQGNVTLRVAGGGATYQVLAPDEASHTSILLNLYRKPSQIWTFAIPYIKAPRRLIYDADEVPFLWGPAVFEELRIEWLINRGELQNDTDVPRPAFLDLVAYDNARRMERQIRPYRR